MPDHSGCNPIVATNYFIFWSRTSSASLRLFCTLTHSSTPPFCLNLSLCHRARPPSSLINIPHLSLRKTHWINSPPFHLMGHSTLHMARAHQIPVLALNSPSQCFHLLSLRHWNVLVLQRIRTIFCGQRW